MKLVFSVHSACSASYIIFRMVAVISPYHALQQTLLLLYHVLQQVENKYEEEKRRVLNELDAVKRRAADKEAAIQKAAAREMDSLTMQVSERGISV